MEEKLYFKPANYGKGKKKKQQTEQRVEHRVLKLFCLLLFLLVIVLIIIWLLRGKTTVSGQYPEDVKNESLTCVSTELVPEKLSGAVSPDKEVKINAIFKGAEELKSISLIYTLNYASSDEAYGFEAKSHAELNKALAASGYNVSKFSNKFTRYDNKLIISLFAGKNEIDQISAPYFSLKVWQNDEAPITLSDYQKNYESRGFICESTIKK